MIDKSDIEKVLNGIVEREKEELMAMSADEIAREWYWAWDSEKDSEWNAYKFFDILETHKSRWRRWEEYHNGSCCVVERVRNKYIMPRVREFLEILRDRER